MGNHPSGPHAGAAHPLPGAAHPNQFTPSDGFFLIAAARSGDVEVLRLFLNKNPALAWAVSTQDKITPWHSAAQEGHLHALTLLGEVSRHGAMSNTFNPTSKAVNQIDARGRTPLMLACRAGHYACAQLLLDLGALWSVMDEDGLTALHHAALAIHGGCVQLLLKKAGLWGEHGPAPPKDKRLFTFLNAGDALYGRTPLHLTAWSGQVDGLVALLEAGADILPKTTADCYESSLPCNNGTTPLHLAAMKGHQNIVVVLMAAYVKAARRQAVISDPRQATDAYGNTPYKIAASRRHDAPLMLQVLNPAAVIMELQRPHKKRQKRVTANNTAAPSPSKQPGTSRPGPSLPSPNSKRTAPAAQAAEAQAAGTAGSSSTAVEPSGNAQPVNAPVGTSSDVVAGTEIAPRLGGSTGAGSGGGGGAGSGGGGGAGSAAAPTADGAGGTAPQGAPDSLQKQGSGQGGGSPPGPSAGPAAGRGGAAGSPGQRASGTGNGARHSGTGSTADSQAMTDSDSYTDEDDEEDDSSGTGGDTSSAPATPEHNGPATLHISIRRMKRLADVYDSARRALVSSTPGEGGLPVAPTQALMQGRTVPPHLATGASPVTSPGSAPPRTAASSRAPSAAPSTAPKQEPPVSHRHRDLSERPVPDFYLCPLTCRVFKDPVVAADGHSYERSAIEKHIQSGSLVSPSTKKKLSSQVLYPNHTLRSAVEFWKAMNPHPEDIA